MHYSDMYEKLRLNEIHIQSIEHPKEYIKCGEGKTATRRIFYGVPTDEFEKKHLQAFKELLTKENFLVSGKIKEEEFLKYLYASQFNLDKAFERVKLLTSWYDDDKNLSLDEHSEPYLVKGIISVPGRDKKLRPVIQINVHEIDLKTIKEHDFLRALNHALHVCQNYMFYPGTVENWILLIETEEMSFFNFPFRTLGSVLRVTSQYFPATLEKCFIVNPSTSLYICWKIVEAFLSEENKKKIQFIKKKDYHILREHINNDQLLERYGGLLSEEYPKWPPVNSIEKHGKIKSKTEDEPKYSFLDNLKPVKIRSNWFFLYINFMGKFLMRR